MPRLGSIVVRSMLLGSRNHAATMRGYSSLYLSPSVEGTDVNDWRDFDQIVEKGYRHAAEVLGTWSGDRAPATS